MSNVQNQVMYLLDILIGVVVAFDRPSHISWLVKTKEQNLHKGSPNLDEILLAINRSQQIIVDRNISIYPV